MITVFKAASAPLWNRRVLRGAAILATLFLATTIAALTLSPPSPHAAGFLSDKAQHAIAFGALALPCAIVYPRALTWVLPLAVVFGAAIEIVQPMVGRDAEFLDFIADIAGLTIGTLAGLTVRPVLRHRLLPR